MKSYKGKVFWEEIEGGTWVFKAEDGNSYILKDSPQKNFQSGATVTITGEVDKNSMSFMMTGPVLKVKEIKIEK